MTERQWLELRQLARRRRWHDVEELALSLPVPWIMLALHARRAELVLPSLQFVIRVLRLDLPDDEVSADHA